MINLNDISLISDLNEIARIKSQFITALNAREAELRSAFNDDALVVSKVNGFVSGYLWTDRWTHEPGGPFTGGITPEEKILASNKHRAWMDGWHSGFLLRRREGLKNNFDASISAREASERQINRRINDLLSAQDLCTADEFIINDPVRIVMSGHEVFDKCVRYIKNEIGTVKSRICTGTGALYIVRYSSDRWPKLAVVRGSNLEFLK